MVVSRPGRRHRAVAAHRELIREFSGEAQARLGRPEAVAFEARLEQQLLDIYEPLEELYGSAPAEPPDRADGVPELFARLVRIALEASAHRPAGLRELDRRREIDPFWYQRVRNVGYVCYLDRFCGTLGELPGKLDYLAELGITYLHLMPLLKPRPGENDGGYAVMDHRTVDPRLGTMADLETAGLELRRRGMSLCVDLVLNHVAKEHPWATGWLAGDPAYADFFSVFPDRELPDAFEQTISPALPDHAPGSFSWVAEANGGAGGWVWTTFWSYQWDLNYANPNVLAAMLETILWLANRGVEIFRMDAVPFLWKRLGSSGRDQPEVHTLMQVLHALTKLAAPAVVFEAEAIITRDVPDPGLGGRSRYRPECELADNNQLMVMLWSSLATRDARLASLVLRRMGQPPAEVSWVTFVHRHDDLSWAVDDQDVAAAGRNGVEHRHFLTDFYTGRYPGSPATGLPFQQGPGAGGARISGSTASLCGVEQALQNGDRTALDLALRRLVLMHAVTFAFGGVPLLYMGDELALVNDHSYLSDPDRAADNRWLHRPAMDWQAAERRTDPQSLECRTFDWMHRLVAARKATLALRAGGQSEVIDPGDARVLAWRRKHPRSGTFVGLANFSEDDVWLEGDRCGLGNAVQATAGPAIPQTPALETLLSSDGTAEIDDGRIRLRGLGFAWLLDP